MRVIDEKKFNRSINKKFSYNFSVDLAALYLIEVTASAKSWWQNFTKLHSFFKDDDLAVEIDSTKFPKLDGRRGLFDGEAAWNGNNLKGLSKTNLFFIHLEKGKHTLSFSSDQKPILGFIKINQIQQGEKVSYIPSINNPAQDGNRRQWLTLAFVDLSLKSLVITAKVQGGKAFSLFKRDDSDIKLIIDGQIQKNDEPKSHKYWYWCGRTLKGETKNFSRELNLGKSLHYIELWADRSPKIEEIVLGFPESRLETEREIEFTTSDVRPYMYKGVRGDENYNRFDDDIVSAVNYWNKKFLSQQYPPPERLHPDLVKAIIYIESRMGYAEVQDAHYPAYPDVMQVANSANPAIHSMRGESGYPANEFISGEEYGHMSYSYLEDRDFPNGGEPEHSIFWGVRWLYHKAQYLPQISYQPYSRKWRAWNEAVQNYNTEGNVEYEGNVYDVYKKGIDKRNRKNRIRLWAVVLFGVLSASVAGISFGLHTYSNQGKAWLSFEDGQEENIEHVLTANIVDGFSEKRTEISKAYKNRDSWYGITKESNPTIYPRNLFGDEDYEFIVTGKTGLTNTMVRYVFKKTKDGLEAIPHNHRGEHDDYIESIRPAFRGDSVEFIDLDGDGTAEVREAKFIAYKNAPDQIWYSWFHYNETKGIYEFVRKDKIESETMGIRY